MPKKIAVIDGNSLMHRAYHAVPATMNAPDGTPTNAAFGFLSMFLKFMKWLAPMLWYARSMLDVRHSAWRHSSSTKPSARRWMLSSRRNSRYRAFARIDERARYSREGLEGDDVLGTVSARDEELGYETLLVSGDKDVYQLMTDRTHVVTTKKASPMSRFTVPPRSRRRYGVTPAQFPDFWA